MIISEKIVLQDVKVLLLNLQYYSSDNGKAKEISMNYIDMSSLSKNIANIIIRGGYLINIYRIVTKQFAFSNSSFLSLIYSCINRLISLNPIIFNLFSLKRNAR